jgi:uncharacterized protein (TIGR02217 family)
MSFFEVQFPTNISMGAMGGPEFVTDIVTINSGYESRNQRWDTPRLKYDVSHAARTISEMSALVSFFRLVKGKAHGFRFKDFSDYTVNTVEGLFAKNSPGSVPSIYATGEKEYQLYKRYPYSSYTTDRKIQKPVAAGFKVYVDGVLQTLNTHYTLDSTTGILTWTQAKATDTVLNYAAFNIGGITLGSTTTITTTAPHSFLVGDRIQLSGIVGTTQLNNIYVTITAVATSTFSFISPNTTGYTAWASGGICKKFPITNEASTPTVHWPAHGYSNGQYTYLKIVSPGGTWVAGSYLISGVSTNTFKITLNSSTLGNITTSATFSKYFTPTTIIAWEGTFDVPVRFDTDFMNTTIQSSIHGSWDSIPLIEIRQ